MEGRHDLVDLKSKDEATTNWIQSAGCWTGDATDQYAGYCNKTKFKFEENAAPENLFRSRFQPGGKALMTCITQEMVSWKTFSCIPSLDKAPHFQPL